MPGLQSVLRDAGDIRIVQEDEPGSLAADCLRLQLATASICGTDLHYFRHFANAGLTLERPVTLGHEACAYVLDANGHDFLAGQLVAINPVIECGECGACQQGAINMCPDKRFPGSATTKPHIDGFFRDHFDFPARCCRPVREGVNPDHLTFAEPLACAMHCVNRAKIGSGDRVLVTGCGPMGLLATVAATAKGAEVHATDIRIEAVQAAMRAGAANGGLVKEGGPPAPAGGYDAVIEASGAPSAYNHALEAVRKQGTIAVLSLIQPSNTPISLHLHALKEVTAVGSILFAGEFAESVALIESGSVDFDGITAGRFSIAQTQAACEMAAGGRAAGKVLIKPSERV